jgi:hypothetical protein
MPVAIDTMFNILEVIKSLLTVTIANHTNKKPAKKNKRVICALFIWAIGQNCNTFIIDRDNIIR